MSNNFSCDKKLNFEVLQRNISIQKWNERKIE